jgi:hypothetical protein
MAGTPRLSILHPMRKALVLTMLAILAVPGTAAARAVQPAGALVPGDGSVSVRNGELALFTLNLNGVALGRIGSGTFEVRLPDGETCDGLPVFGEERAIPEVRVADFGLLREWCVYTGQDIRVRLVSSGSQLVMRIKKARDVGFSAVGRGSGSLQGSGGQWALNGAPYAAVPLERIPFQLAAPPANG